MIASHTSAHSTFSNSLTDAPLPRCHAAVGWLAYQMGFNPRNFFNRLQVDSAAVRRLFNAVDFIGISAYASITPDFALSELQNSAYEFADGMSIFGMDVLELITEGGKELHYSEYGMGGGTGYK